MKHPLQPVRPLSFLGIRGESSPLDLAGLATRGIIRA
jgi:hypothetical protein